MTEALMRALANQAAFLALSGEDVVNPDAAVAQLEQISADLQALTQAERNEFVTFTRELAKREQDPERAEFFESLVENLGLVD